MKNLDGRYLLIDNKIINAENYFIHQDFTHAVFEVVRIINGKILFFEDHINRLKISVEKMNGSFRYNINKLKIDLENLCKQEQKQFGNIRIIVNIETRKHAIIQHLFAFFMKHHYPDIDDYKNGVILKSYSIERQNPHIKIVSSEIRERVKFLLKDGLVYEILLIDSESYIREGSKSNVFFIKNNEVFTPPGETVLKGITRKYVIEICKKHEIKINEENIRYSDISDFEVTFLTGTSPKVLPVSRIDDYFYSKENELLRFIMDKYEEEVVSYIANNQGCS